MPRNLKPDVLKTGSGKRVPEKGTTVSLTGGGMAGPGPNIGQDAWMSPSGVVPLPYWVRARLNASGAAGAALHAHINSPKGAHKASAISLDGYPETILSDNVEGAFDEVVGVFPPQPPMLGSWSASTTFSGITDWGDLKTNDRGVVARGLVPVTVGSQLDELIYPYYYKQPSPLVVINDSPWPASGGQDPTSDLYWNTDVVWPGMWGTGPGSFFTGGYSRPGTAINDPVMRSTLMGYRNGTLDTVTGLPLKGEVTFSGTLYPADRGVLALIHWPAGVRGTPPSITEFLAQPLLDRVVAALLVGQGILGQGCDGGDNDCDDGLPCDGDPGGIFSLGEDADGNYDPYAFPGRASGQYDLREILRGINNLDGQDLNAPFDGGAVVAPHRDQNSTVPAAGQVRLGTDPNAGLPDPSGWGIPILGANEVAYDPAPATVANVVALRIGHKVIGNSIFSMEDPANPASYINTNFFRYRLPYLKDYTEDGLKWTPSGADHTSTLEKARFFEVEEPASPTAAGTSLVTAGNYGVPFNEDYFTWQVARYRHSFLMPSTAGVGEEEECGSYWFIHFKKEADFEAYVRDGTMPWDVTDGYEIYGAETIDATDPVEGSGNLVNEVSSMSAFVSPDGPAPAYGYVAPPYFQRRSNILLDYFAHTPSYSGTFTWAVREPRSVVYTSGVASYVARKHTDGFPNIEISALDVVETTALFFDRAYRTDESWLTGQNLVAPGVDDPALLSSPAPAMLTFFTLGYGAHPSAPVDSPNSPSLTFPLDADTGAGLSDPNSPQVPSRVEIPFTHLGPGGVNQYSDSNAPQRTDSLVIGMGTGAHITTEGDDATPAFTELAQPRAFFRRPLGHRTVTTSVEPYAANDGHGIPVPTIDDYKIFLHTTIYNPAGCGGPYAGMGTYGNFTIGGLPAAAPAGLFTALKDVEERFLDETYRWSSSFQRDVGDPDQIADIAGYGAPALAQLQGPGMGAWVGGGIEVPVRAGLTAGHSLRWAYQAWLPMETHQTDLNTIHTAGAGYTSMVPELQVKGWPDRNPPLTDRANAPIPSSGLLVYPQRDYCEATDPLIRPNLSIDLLVADQPDYTTPSAEASYVRAFDASFNGTVLAAGQPFFTIRIDGVTLGDFAYSAPGPGSLVRLDANGNTFLAIMVKVPGLTTWMDLGRPDGAGPSKQDVFLDGAGCAVTGPETKTGTDAVSGIVYAQVKVNVGPAMNLFASTGIEGTTVGEVPVLVKVVMRSTAKAFSMDNEFDGASFQGTVAGPGFSYSQLRGICGIKLIDPTA